MKGPKITQTARLPEQLSVIVLVCVGMFFRRSDAFTNPQLWAEDGTVFLQQHLNNGFHAIFMPYAGYFHSIPRLVALIVGSINPTLSYVPLLFNLSFLILALGMALHLLSIATYNGIRHRIAFSVLFVFLPIGAEMFMNLTNSIWITAIYPITFLIWGYKVYEEMSASRRGLVIAFLLLSALTGPFSLLLSPVVLWILIANGKSMNVRQVIPYAVLLIGGLVQLLSIKYSGGISRAIPGAPEQYHIWLLLTNNISELLFLNTSLIPNVSFKAVSAITMVVLVAGMFGVIWSYRRLHLSRKYVLIAVSVLFFASFIAAFWPSEYLVTGLGCPRYYFIPELCMGWLLLLAIDKALRGIDIVFYSCFFLLHGQREKSELPDKNWKQQILELKEGNRQTLDINPDGWKIEVPPNK